MTYRITYEPLNRIVGVKPTTIEIENAEDAWREVEGLMHSDERVMILDGSEPISWQTLRDRVTRKNS
jgi:hypothetical protein